MLTDFDLVSARRSAGAVGLNLLDGLDLPEKVPGPTVVDRLLEIAADEGCGSTSTGAGPRHSS